MYALHSGALTLPWRSIVNDGQDNVLSILDTGARPAQCVAADPNNKVCQVSCSVPAQRATR
jgi:hypothetical protein